MFKWLLNKYETYRLKKYYQSIKEMPAEDWLNMLEENDYKYLSKSRKICKRAKSVYENLQGQIIDNFGANKDYLKLIRNKVEIQLMYQEQVNTGDKSNQALIDILILENEKIQTNTTHVDNYEVLIGIEKNLQFDIKKKSVYEFYKYANILSKQG